MKDFISQTELAFAIENIYKYLQTRDSKCLQVAQNEIKKAKEIDFSIKTYQEYRLNEAFIPSSHGVNRMAVMLLNSLGENYLEQGILTIHQDDPKLGFAEHTNTYRLVLKDIDTHINFYTGNPTAEDKPYDFDTNFISQITRYQNGNTADTTKHAWDSFNPGYKNPIRTLDFKSALWKKDHEHFVNYIFQIMDDGSMVVFAPGKRDQLKQIEFKPKPENLHYLDQYLQLLSSIKAFDSKIYNLNWDNFILKDMN